MNHSFLAFSTRKSVDSALKDFASKDQSRREEIHHHGRDKLESGPIRGLIRYTDEDRRDQ